MKLKKFLAGVCTGALALSLAVPAFASNITNDNSTTFTGAAASTAGGTVSVRVRTASTKLYVNPYGVSYDLPYGEVKTAGAAFNVDEDLVITQGNTAAGFFSDTALIENNSTSALKVGATLTTTDKAGVKFVGAAPAGGTAADNTLYGNFEITSATVSTGAVKVSDASGNLGSTATAGVTIVTPNWADTNKKTFAIPAGAAGAGGSAGAGTPGTMPAAQQYTLAAATSTTDPVTQAVTVTPSYAAYRLTGTALIGTTNNLWPTADVADVVVALTFTPAP